MPKVTEIVEKVWKDRDGPVVLATADQEGVPNAVYSSCVNTYGADKVVIADTDFQKTRSNILAGSKGAILFRLKDGRSFQLKGPIDYCTEGKIYEDMMSWLYPKYSEAAAIVLNIEAIYCGTKKLL